MTLTKDLNDLAGTNGLQAQGAANALAGTNGKALVGALNAAAGTDGLELQGVLGRLGGVPGVAPDGALSEMAFIKRTAPALWLDARFPNGFGGSIPADGTALSQWNDLSGNGRHATQATGTEQPLFRSANPNLLTYNQATVETDTTGLAALNGNSTIARSTTDAAHGTASLQVTSVAAGLTGANTLTGSSGVPVAASTQYTAVISAKAPTITANWTPIIYWWKANGTASATPSTSGTAAALTTSYAQLFVTATSPSDAAFATVGFSWTAVAASEVVRVDRLGSWLGSSTTWLPPVTLPNGLATVQFDGLNDTILISTLNFLSLPGVTIYAVAETPPGTTGGSPLVAGLMNGSFAVRVGLYGNASGQTTLNTRRLDADTLSPYTPSGTVTAGHHMLAAVVNYSNASVSVSRDGSVLSTSPSWSAGVSDGSTAISILQVGNSNRPGAIAAVLVYQVAHTTAQRQAVERWLGRVYGVAVA